MRLILAEADRLRSRRITLIALILVVLAVGAFQFAVRAQVAAPSPSEVARGQAEFEQAHNDWQRNHQTYEQQCLDDGEPPENCAYSEPQIADFVRQPASFAAIAPISITVSTYLVALAAFLVAGSFIGAEFSTGSIANWLTFVPNRLRVFGSKLVVVVAYATVFGVVVCGLSLLATGLLAHSAGAAMGGMKLMILQAGRGVAIVVALTVVGFCLGFLLRNTAAVTGAVLGYFAVMGGRGILSLFLPWVAELARWTPEANLSAILNKSYGYTIQHRLPDGQMEDIQRSIGLTHGLLYWGVLLAVLIVVSAVVFRRRDVS